MNNTIQEDIELYQHRLKVAEEKLRDAQFDLKRAKQDLADAKRGERRAKSKPVQRLLKQLGPSVTHFSLVGSYVYIQTANAKAERVPQDFYLYSSRPDYQDSFTQWGEFANKGDLSFVRILNKYDPRQVVV